MPYALIVGAIFGPLIWSFIRGMYPGMGEEHVHRIEARDYLPRDDIEISAKEYFKINFTAACFLPGYFYFIPDDDDDRFLRNTLNYKGSLPRHFSLSEGRWGIIFMNNNSIYKIIYTVNMGYPSQEILNKLKLKQISSPEKSSLICLQIKENQDFIMKFKRSEDSYVPVSVQVQIK